jgi:hypothetical protein
MDESWRPALRLLAVLVGWSLAGWIIGFGLVALGFGLLGSGLRSCGNCDQRGSETSW